MELVPPLPGPRLAGRELNIRSGRVTLAGLLQVPAAARGVVVFAHGGGSGRHSPRNGFIAGELQRAGFATLLMDLLTPEEDRDRVRRFDIDRLTERLGDGVRKIEQEQAVAALPLGLFGAGAGAAAALRLAEGEPHRVKAVVSRGGRPDLAGDTLLERVRTPTLLIVGGLDIEVLGRNHAATELLCGPNHLAVVPGASHLFEEGETLKDAARLACDWFEQHLAGAEGPTSAT